MKHFARLSARAKRAGDQAQVSGKEVRQIRAQFEVATLRYFENFHHRLRLLLENVGALREQLSLPDSEMTKTFLGRFQAWEKAEKRTRR
jgi:hypothetical protein